MLFHKYKSPRQNILETAWRRPANDGQQEKFNIPMSWVYQNYRNQNICDILNIQWRGNKPTMSSYPLHLINSIWIFVRRHYLENSLSCSFLCSFIL